MTNGTLLCKSTALALGATIAFHGTAHARVASPAPADPTATTDPSNQGDAANGDIVVTAQRREQTLQTVPVAVTAFNAQMLQNRSITDVIKIAQSVPGLYLSQGTASPNTLQIGMRGALEQNGGTITSESPVAIYIDDVYQSRLSAANYDLADIQRIEVLRGPQGTLYGRNSMTGAIKLITRQPNGDTWLNTDVSFGRFQEAKAKVSLGAPIANNVALAASAFYDDRNDGWQYDVTTKERVGTFRNYGGQLALGLTNVNRFSAVLTGRYLRSTNDGQHFMPLKENFGQAPATDLALPFYQTATPFAAKGDDETYTASLKLGYDLGWGQLKSITAYQHLNEEWALDFSGGTTKFLNPVTFTTDIGTDAGVGFYRDSPGRQHQITQEFQLAGKALNDKLNYIAGVFYFDEHATQRTEGDIYLGVPSVPSDISTTSRSIAGYAQADYEILPHLTASGGIRFSHDNKTFLGHTPDGFGDLHTLNYAVKDSVWTPRVNLQWQFSDKGQVYATVSKGYRAGGFNSLNTGDPLGYGVPYKPEKAWSYEVGAKIQTFDRRLTTNIAAYYERLTDLQTLAFGAVAGSFLFQNAARAKVEGIEFETSFKVTKAFNLFGNATYTYDHYGKLDPASQAAQTGATRLPLISRWQYQVGGEYDLPLNESTLALAMDYSYRSQYYSLVTLADSSRQKGIGRGNASVTYKSLGDHYEIYGQASNISNNRDYFASAEFVAGVFGYKIPLEPRVWRIGFRYKY